MDDAVSGGDQLAFAMTLDPREEFGEKRLVSESGAGRPAPLGAQTPGRIHSAEMRRRADPLDLPFGDEGQVTRGTGLEKSKFEARGSGIKGEDVATRRPTPLCEERLLNTAFGFLRDIESPFVLTI